MTERNNGCLYRPGKDVIFENDFDISEALLNRLPTSDVDARPPWRLDPFLGTWPNDRRRRRAEAEASQRARLAESELLVSEYREQEERARDFDDDDEFVPCLSPPLGLTQGFAAPAAMGARPEPTSSLPLPSGTSQSRISKAVPIRRPGDGIAVSIPKQASSSTGRLSKAIPIVRPDDGTTVILPPLNRAARQVSSAPRVSLGHAEREREMETAGIVEPTSQSSANATTSTGATEIQGSKDVPDGGDRTPRASRASTPVGIRESVIRADGSTDSSEFVYVESRGNRV